MNEMINSLFQFEFNYVVFSSFVIGVGCSFRAWLKCGDVVENNTYSIVTAGVAGAAIPNAVLMVFGGLFPNLYLKYATLPVFGSVFGVAALYLAVEKLKKIR